MILGKVIFPLQMTFKDTLFQGIHNSMCLQSYIIPSHVMMPPENFCLASCPHQQLVSFVNSIAWNLLHFLYPTELQVVSILAVHYIP